jgi:hypothetical protein
VLSEPLEQIFNIYSWVGIVHILKLVYQRKNFNKEYITLFYEVSVGLTKNIALVILLIKKLSLHQCWVLSTSALSELEY